MKFLQRILAIILTISMLLMALTTAAVAAGSISNFRQVRFYSSSVFSDVGPEMWFEESVKNAYQLGLMSGVSEHTFSPYGNITLAQAVVMAVRLHSIYNNTDSKFDSNGGTWYSGYVNYAKNVGILTRDYADYNKPATRAEFAAILAHAFPESALETINRITDGEISDVPAAYAYAKEIYLLYRAGVLSGSANTIRTFHPADSIQRAEAASIVARMALPDQRIELARVAVPASEESSAEITLLLFWSTGINLGVPEKETEQMAAYLGDIDRLYKEYADNNRVDIRSANVGDSVETLQTFANKYAEQYHYAIPVEVEKGEELLNDLGIDAIPCLLLMTQKEDTDLLLLQNRISYDDLKAVIEELLADS